MVCCIPFFRCLYLAFLGFFVLHVSLGAQTVTVRDFETNAPLSNVHVYNDQRTILKISDAKGQVDISDFEDAEDILFFNMFSYEFTFSNKEYLQAMGNEIYLDFSTLPEVILSINRKGVEQRQVPEQVSVLTEKKHMER